MLLRLTALLANVILLSLVDAQFNTRLSSTGSFVVIHSENITSSNFSLSLSEPSSKIAGLLLKCDVFCGPLNLTILFDNKETRQAVLWPVLNLTDSFSKSGVPDCNVNVSCSNNSMTPRNNSCPPSQDDTQLMASSFYEYHISPPSDVDLINVSFHEMSNTCLPNVPPQNDAQKRGRIIGIDVIEMADGIERNETIHEVKDQSEFIFPVNVTTEIAATWRIIIDVFNQNNSKSSSIAYLPRPAVSLLFDVSSNSSGSMETTTVQTKCGQITQSTLNQDTEDSVQFITVVPVNSDLLASNSPITSTPVSSPSSTLSSISSRTTNSAVPNINSTFVNTTTQPSRARVLNYPPSDAATDANAADANAADAVPNSSVSLLQKVTFHSLKITFPFCMAFNFKIKLEYFHSVEGDNPDGNSSNDKGSSGKDKSTRVPTPSPTTKTVSQSKPTTQQTTMTPYETSSKAGATDKVSTTIITSATAASSFSTITSAAVTPTTQQSLSVTALSTSGKCSSLPTTTAVVGNHNYKMRFAIIEPFNADLSNSSSQLYANYSGYIDYTVKAVLWSEYCMRINWTRPIVFMSGSIITQSWFTLIGDQLNSSLSGQIKDSIINALTPRFNINSSSFDLGVDDNTSGPTTKSTNIQEPSTLSEAQIIGIGVGCGMALLLIIVFIVALIVCGCCRHPCKKDPPPLENVDNAQHDMMVSSWSIPRPQQLVWQSNATVTSSVMARNRQNGHTNGVRPTTQADNRDINGFAQYATAELDQVIAQHENMSDISSLDSQDRGVMHRQGRLHRMDTDVLYSQAKHSPNVDEHSRTNNSNRQAITPINGQINNRDRGPEIRNAASSGQMLRDRRIPALEVLSEDAMVRQDFDDRRNVASRALQLGSGVEQYEHVSHRQFDEESFTEALTYYGSTGNLQKGGVLTRLQHSISKATNYLMPHKADNIHRTPPKYLKPTSARDRPTRQREEELIL